MAWSPDGRFLASGATDGRVILWNAADDPAMGALAQSRAGINCVAWSPDGQFIAAGGADQTITLSSAFPQKLLRTLRGHTGRVNAVAWNPDGTRLASASEDKTIKFWDTSTGKETLTVDGPEHGYAVAWSPDGLMVASGGSDQTILIHDSTTGYAAALAPPYLSVLSRRIAADPSNPADWRLRAQIHAGVGDWDDAAADLKSYLALKPDERWCSLGYWVAGPYPEDLNAHYPPEINPDPATRVPVFEIAEPSPAFLNWQRVPLNSAGFVNFGSLFGNADHISAYALLRVYCPQETPVAIFVGNDDQLRLWMNGRQIYEDPERHAAEPDAAAVAATLVPGWNTILARVVNVTGPHALYLRLSHAPADLARARGNKSGDKP